MERKSVKICDVVVGERYNLSPACELNHSFTVDKIDEVGVWTIWYYGGTGLFLIDDTTSIYEFPLSPLEKELA